MCHVLPRTTPYWLIRYVPRVTAHNTIPVNTDVPRVTAHNTMLVNTVLPRSTAHNTVPVNTVCAARYRAQHRKGWYGLCRAVPCIRLIPYRKTHTAVPTCRAVRAAVSVLFIKHLSEVMWAVGRGSVELGHLNLKFIDVVCKNLVFAAQRAHMFHTAKTRQLSCCGKIIKPMNT